MRYVIIDELKLTGRDAPVRHYLEQLEAFIESKKAKLVFTGDWLGQLSDDMAYSLVALCQKSLGVINAGVPLERSRRLALNAIELVDDTHGDNDICFKRHDKGLTITGKSQAVTILFQSMPSIHFLAIGKRGRQKEVDLRFESYELDRLSTPAHEVKKQHESLLLKDSLFVQRLKQQVAEAREVQKDNNAIEAACLQAIGDLGLDDELFVYLMSLTSEHQVDR